MATLRDEIASDFSRGMEDSAAVTAFPRDAVELLLNGRVEPDGTISVRPGSRRKHLAAIADDTGYGGITFQPSTGPEQIVAIVGSTAKYSVNAGATWIEIATGLREDYYSFATMRVGATTYLFAANGDTTIKRWDGATWDDLPGAPSGVKFIAIFNGRLYATGHNGPLVQASAIADPEEWTRPAGLLIQMQAHDGNDPTGMHQVGKRLLLFTRSSTAYVEGYGEATIIVAAGATGFSESVGCIGFRTIASVGDNAICWLSERGIEHYSPDRGIVLRSAGIREFFRDVARSEMKGAPGMASATYDAANHHYHLALSTTGAQNDRVIVLNLLTGALAVDQFTDAEDGTVTFTVDADGYLTAVLDGSGYEGRSIGSYFGFATTGSSGDPVAVDAEGVYLESITVGSLPATLFMGPSEAYGSSLHSLGYDGFLREHVDETLDDVLLDGTGGAAINFIVVSRPFTFGYPYRKKVRLVRIATINDATATVTVRVRAGGEISNVKTLTMGPSGLDQPTRAKARPKGVGDAPQVEIRTSDPIRLAMIGVSAEILRETY